MRRLGEFERASGDDVHDADERDGLGIGTGEWPGLGRLAHSARRWHFTYGDDGWTNGFAWVEGYFRSKFRSRANEIRLLSDRLALCPAANWSRYNLAASRAWCVSNVKCKMENVECA